MDGDRETFVYLALDPATNAQLTLTAGTTKIKAADLTDLRNPIQ